MAKKAKKATTKAKKAIRFSEKPHNHVQGLVAKAFQQFKVVDLMKKVDPEKKQKIIIQAAKNLSDVSGAVKEPDAAYLKRARQVSNYFWNPKYAKDIMKKGGIKAKIERMTAKPSDRRPVAKKSSAKARSKVTKKAPTTPAAPATETAQAAA